MYKPSISICIATYNRAKYLKEAINSALNQTYKNFEILVVNDGSTDNTEEVVSEFKCEKINYYKKEHTNCPDTRNYLINMSHGEYLLWFDDDDLLLSNFLEIYVNYINKFPEVDIFYCYLNLFDDSGLINTRWEYEDWYKRKREMLAWLIKGQPNPQPSSLIKRKVFDEIGYYDKNINVSSDYDYFARIIIAQRYEFKLINEYLYLYRKHSTNICYNAIGKPSNYYDTKTLNKILSENNIEIFFPYLEWKYDYNKSLSEAYYIIGIRFFNYFSYNDCIYYLVASFRLIQDIDKLSKAIQSFIDVNAIKELKIFLFFIKDIFKEYEEIENIIKIVKSYQE